MWCVYCDCDRCVQEKHKKAELDAKVNHWYQENCEAIEKKRQLIDEVFENIKNAKYMLRHGHADAFSELYDRRGELYVEMRKIEIPPRPFG